MRVLKIKAEGTVTSFRYPHFVQGVHPTYEMPPPATIYGHLCSAVGDYFDPTITQFAYHFTCDAHFSDYEHLHFFGKEPKMNPFRRELLFNPRLTLYLTNLDFAGFFLSPRYPVALGRAQDLMTYVDVQEIELNVADAAFYENTLLPLPEAALIGGRTFAVTMPRFIDENRHPSWDQYAVLLDRVEYPNTNALDFEGNHRSIVVDPQADAKHPTKSLQRGIIWHSWR